jgi:hypothetical protein
MGVALRIALGLVTLLCVVVIVAGKPLRYTHDEELK